jgi:hypothetical protein
MNKKLTKEDYKENYTMNRDNYRDYDLSETFNANRRRDASPYRPVSPSPMASTHKRKTVMKKKKSSKTPTRTPVRKVKKSRVEEAPSPVKMR